jgi:sec-independent protein translocase protein TatA
MSLGPVETGLIVLAVMLLFGYKKLPDASRSLGSSFRIFKSEVEDLRSSPTTADAAALVGHRFGAGTMSPNPAHPASRGSAVDPHRSE